MIFMNESDLPRFRAAGLNPLGSLPGGQGHKVAPHKQTRILFKLGIPQKVVRAKPGKKTRTKLGHGLSITSNQYVSMKPKFF